MKLLIFIERKRILIGFLFAFLSVFMFSSLSPLRGGLPVHDSSVFLNIGRSFLEGKILYKDIFDHKGPIIFLINALGLLIGGGSPYGVFVLELLSMSIIFYVVNKLLEQKDISVIIFVNLVLFLLLNHSFEGGNSTEEYIILPSVISIYLFFKSRDSKLYYFLQSLLLSIIFLIKPNGICTVFVIIIFSLLYDLKKKRYIQVGRGVLISLFTAAFVFLIFYFYFLYYHAQTDFMDGLLFFNLKYINNSIELKIRSLMFFGSNFTIEFFLIIYMMITFWLRGKRVYFFEIFILLLITYLSVGLGGNNFRHYFLLFFPVLVFGFVRFFHNWDKALKIDSTILISLFFVFLISFQPNTKGIIFDDYKYKKLISSFGITSDQNAMSIGITLQSRFYLYSGIKISQKWFFPLTLSLDTTGNKVDLVLLEIKNKKPDYLVIDEDWYLQNVSNIIFDSYDKYFDIVKDRSIVFKRNDNSM